MNMERKNIDLIKVTFDEILNIKPIVATIEDDILYGIFDQTHRSENMKLRDLLSYSPEYGIDKSVNDKWIFLVLKYYPGDYFEPDDWDYVDNDKEYDSFEDALQGLIQYINNEKFETIKYTIQYDYEQY